MKKIVVFLSLAFSSFAFSQSGDLVLINGNLASDKYINKLKNQKTISAGSSTTFEGIAMKKYSTKSVSYDAISLERLNVQNGLPANNPVLVNGKRITNTSIKVVMDSFTELNIKTIEGNKTIVLSSL